MDPVSQISLGAGIGALFRPRLGGRAIVLGGICGGVPDLDVIIGMTSGPWARMLHHRGATHALLVLTLAAPVFGWLGDRYSRYAARQEGRPPEPDFWGWTHLAFWALTTHALLDWCTPYGTQLLWPFTTRRLALDAAFSVDFFYTVPLLGLLLVSLWPRFSPTAARRVALAGLLISTAYLAFGVYQQARGVALGRAQLAELGVEPVAIRAVPTFSNPFVRRVVARDAESNLYLGLISTWNPQPAEFLVLPRSDDPDVQTALNSQQGQIFAWFTDGMFYAQVIRRDKQGTRVLVSDARYGFFVRPTETMIRTLATLDSDGQLVDFGRAGGPNIVFAEEYRRLQKLLIGEERSAPVLVRLPDRLPSNGE